MSSRPLVIANPAAGRGDVRTRFRRLAAALMERVGAADVHWTQEPGEAHRLARNEAGARPLLIAAGGDGTVSEVARGIAGAGAAELGILPFGTGNDFARGVGVPARPADALRILAGPARPTDLGSAAFSDRQPRLFLNSLSLGLAAAVNRRTSRERGFGRASYAVNAAREALGYAPQTFTLSLDGAQPRPRVLVNISFMNSGRFGGGIPLTPGAVPGDGKLDVALIAPLRFVGWVDAVRRLFSGSHFERAELEHARVERGSVRCESGGGPTALEIDGELVETTGTVQVEVAAAAVRVRRP